MLKRVRPDELVLCHGYLLDGEDSLRAVEYLGVSDGRHRFNCLFGNDVWRLDDEEVGASVFQIPIPPLTPVRPDELVRGTFYMLRGGGIILYMGVGGGRHYFEFEGGPEGELWLTDWEVVERVSVNRSRELVQALKPEGWGELVRVTPRELSRGRGYFLSAAEGATEVVYAGRMAGLHLFRGPSGKEWLLDDEEVRQVAYRRPR